MSGNKSVEELIAASSLGTPEAVSIRRQVSAAVVARVLKRSDELQKKEIQMRAIKLETAVGEHVANVEILPLPDKEMPEVVLWGNRVFHFEAHAIARTRPDLWVYRECFAVVSLTPSPGIELA